MVEQTGEFEYNGTTDEVALHTNQQTFVGAMIQEGLTDLDD